MHYLDVGGAAPPEASGVETVLAGLRAALSDDDQLLTAASNIWDGCTSNSPRRPEHAAQPRDAAPAPSASGKRSVSGSSWA